MTRRTCPDCGHLTVTRVLDLPACQRPDCGWAGSRPVRDDEWSEAA